MERRKKKQLVRIELQMIKPSLGILNAAGESQPAQWKRFKHDYNVSNATVRVLLEALGEDFFSPAKLTRNKHKSYEELSPYAEEFFRVFLHQRAHFQKPVDLDDLPHVHALPTPKSLFQEEADADLILLERPSSLTIYRREVISISV